MWGPFWKKNWLNDNYIDICIWQFVNDLKFLHTSNVMLDYLFEWMWLFLNWMKNKKTQSW